MMLDFRHVNASIRLRLLLAVGALANLPSVPLRADASGTKPATAYSALSERTFHEYTVPPTTALEAADDIPECCRVLGVLPSEIVFEIVVLPEWNGHIVMRGNGGDAGNAPDNRRSIRASERTAADGFMSAYTNTGRDRTEEPLGTFEPTQCLSLPVSTYSNRSPSVASIHR